MHNIKRDPQQDPDIYASTRLTPGQSVGTPNTVLATDGGTQPILTSFTRTIQETISQPATTFLTTHTDVFRVTDSSQFSSLQAADASSSAARASASSTKTSSTPSATSTADSKSSSSSNLGTLIPAIVVPVAAVLIVSFVLFWFVMRRRHQRQIHREPEFVMASKPEKQISRGNSNSSGHSSTRELVPMSKLEKEVSISASEVKRSPADMLPPKYSSAAIGVARPMTPPDKATSGPAVKEKSFPNFSSVRPSAPHKSGMSRDRSDSLQKSGNSANAQRSVPPPRTDSRNSPPRSARGPSIGAMHGPPSHSNRPSRSDAIPPPITTNMKNGSRAAPPKALEPPTPTGAFNGASPISQYSPIIKSPFSLDAIAVSSSGGQAPQSFGAANTTYNYGKDSPVDESILSKENMRIARLANSSRLGLSNSPVEPDFPLRGTNNTKVLSPLSEGDSKIEPATISPRLPPPLTRDDLPTKPFAQTMDSPAPGSSIYPSPTIGGPTPRIGTGPSTTSLVQNNNNNIYTGSSANPYLRASVISRLSSDDGYVDMDVDAKSDVSSLDEREKWDMESGRQAVESRLGAGYNAGGYGSAGVSPIDGPAGASSAGTGKTKPSIRDRDSEGPFVLSRY